MARIGYVRVSTVDQNTARQEVIMEQLGVEKLFMEKASGKNLERSQLTAMLDYVREGDTLVVESLNRLSRSLRDFLNILDMLEQKGVTLHSQKEFVDTSTPSGRLMVNIFASVNQFDREAMLERQAEGIAAAKVAGKYNGRKPIDIDMDDFRYLCKKVKSGNMTVNQVCRRLGISRTTYYRKERECVK